jgi:subtilisin family serine protease
MPIGPKRQRAAARLALLLVVGAVVPLVSSAARAATVFSAEGHIQFSNLFGLSTTEAEWQLTCPELPDSQGEDAHIFTLPEDLDVSGTTTTAAGSSASVYDLDILFYGDDCGTTGSSFEVGTDETAGTPDGTNFVLVTAFEGSDIDVTLTVGTGADPEPTPTPTPTPTTTPTSPGGTRGTYPATPNDPLFSPDPDLPEILGGQWGMRKIQAPEAWQEQRATGFGIKVAVLDTGLDLDHPDFDCPGKVEVIQQNDFIGDGNGPEDGAGHGTHVAGIVGACTNNNEGVVGVAPDATIMPIQVLDASGSGVVTETLPGAIRAATDAGAHVINMSIGTLPVNTPTDILFGEVFPEVDEAVEYATSNGVVVVAAAGNETFPLCSYPAIIEDIVCVGSSDNRDLNSYFGNFPVNDDNEDGLGAGLLAPGGSGQVFCDAHAENIVSTYLVAEDNCDEGFPGYIGLDGTSMASPHVAGAAALVYDRLAGDRTEANGRQVINALISSADDLYAPGYDPASGYGRLNALEAVRSVDAAPDPDPTPTVATPQNTDLAFTGTTPGTGQFTDEVSIQAALTDDAGSPLAGRDVSFQLLGPQGFVQRGAVTNEDGVADATLTLDVPPGEYELSVAFAGEAATYNASSAGVPFTLTKEVSASTIQVSGKASKKIITGALADGDDGTRSISGAPVTFLADGAVVGSGTTDDHGMATLEVPSGSKGKKIVYEFRFSGNDFFEESSSSTG